MATEPEDDQLSEPIRQRATRIIAAPVGNRQARTVTALAISGALASLAPDPFGPLAVALIVYLAFDRAKR